MVHRMGTLHVKLRDGHVYKVEAEGENDKALEKFVARSGEFAREWVQLATPDRTTKYVRYDEISEVHIVS
jgi:hypothetical protein